MTDNFRMGVLGDTGLKVCRPRPGIVSRPLDTAEMERVKTIGDHVHKTVKSLFA